ncbi:MAG: hypothetical protein WC533_01555 [Candidatus Pacearchaeota archaeon]
MSRYELRIGIKGDDEIQELNFDADRRVLPEIIFGSSMRVEEAERMARCACLLGRDEQDRII